MASWPSTWLCDWTCVQIVLYEWSWLCKQNLEGNAKNCVNDKQTTLVSLIQHMCALTQMSERHDLEKLLLYAWSERQRWKIQEKAEKLRWKIKTWERARANTTVTYSCHRAQVSSRFTAGETAEKENGDMSWSVVLPTYSWPSIQSYWNNMSTLCSLTQSVKSVPRITSYWNNMSTLCSLTQSVKSVLRIESYRNNMSPLCCLTQQVKSVQWSCTPSALTFCTCISTYINKEDHSTILDLQSIEIIVQPSLKWYHNLFSEENFPHLA